VKITPFDKILTKLVLVIKTKHCPDPKENYDDPSPVFIDTYKKKEDSDEEPEF
jgi:hypothetical protein